MRSTARRRPVALACALCVVAVAGCSSDEPAADSAAAPSTAESPVSTGSSGSPPASDVFAPTATTTVATDATTDPTATTSTTTTSTTTTSTTTTTTTTTTTSTTTTSTTLPPGTPAPGPLDLAADRLVLGTSVEGREIAAERPTDTGGRRVLVIGVIHGNEDAGVQVVDELRRRAVDGEIPPEIELWLVESMNPDGQLIEDRHNANEVDLNRNFPHNWGPIGQPGDGQYAGPGPASEPETQAMVPFIEALRPDIAIWYHQDANLIIPSNGRQGRIRARYAGLTDLPLEPCCAGGIYTGTAATWARVTLSDQEAVPFIVELPGGELSPEQVTAHSDAVITIGIEG
ncbi:MAG: M14 family zinc carboxypeptidase [Actinomycetota bacterium]